MNNKGFTLIEIAVVLVIIGLIIGAAVKGKDLIQSGKQKKFYTNFIKSWELVVLNYYDRTGYALGDGEDNGGTTGQPINGVFDNISGANFDSANGVDARLKAIGLTVPSTNTDESGQMSFKGQTSGTVTVTIGLYYYPSATDGRSNNILYLSNIPTDLAIALDTMIDGSLDPSAGTFRRYTDNLPWPDVTATSVVNAMYILDVP